MAREDRLLSLTSRCVCLRVSMTSPLGCWPIVCSQIPARLPCSGARHQSSRRHQLPTSALRIGSDLVKPRHVQKQLPTASPFYANCAVPTSVYHTLVVALVLSRLDYGNAVLVGLPAYLYNRLRSQCSTLTRDPSPAYDAPTISPTHSLVSTG